MFKKTTKRALLASVLALVLCVSMLVGTTFAWFTDSVTSSNNVIKSGNLDIVLEYWDGDSWEDVAGKSNIITNTLWEPGATEVAYLRIANAGSLALKYMLGINIVSEQAGVNVAGQIFKLSDYIQFGVVEGVNGQTGAYADREAAIAAVTDAKKISAGYTKSSAMTSGQELYLALVVYMPTTVGNEANHDGTNVPQIDLGINVFATQNTVETDSFGTDYDAGAWDMWDGVAVSTEWYDADTTATEFVLSSAADVAGFAQIVNNGTSFKNKTVKLAADINLMGNVWTPVGIASQKPFSGTFDGQGHTIANFTLKTSSGNYGAGFFGNLVGNPTVKNVNFDSVSYTTRANCVGVVAGYLYSSATFENINVTNANVQSFGKVGGIVGLVADPGAHTVTLTNCSVEGTIGGGYNVGGLMGLVLQGVTVNVTDCSTDVEFIMNDSGYDMEYVKNDNGEWMWNYNNQWNYAAVAEQYCYYDAAENEFCMGEPADVTFTVSGPNQLKKALAAGGTVVLGSDITVAKNETITVASGTTATIDLNGYKISSTADKTGNQELFLVKGNLTVKNGSMSYTASNNQGWGAMITIFDVTAGGVLTMDNVTASVAGSDMNFIVHLNNWGSATLNVNDCDFTASYVAIRAFNSGYDMNNVTVENTAFHGGRVFWVHNYTAEGAGDATLNVDIYGNGNTTDNAQPVRYGFSNSIFFDINGNQLA